MKPCDIWNEQLKEKQFHKTAETCFQHFAESVEKGRYVAVGSHGVSIPRQRYKQKKDFVKSFGFFSRKNRNLE
jgi:hypothetical protein